MFDCKVYTYTNANKYHKIDHPNSTKIKKGK